MHADILNRVAGNGKTAASGRKKGATTIARAYLEAIGRQDLDAACALWRPGGIDRLIGMAELRAPEGVRDYFGTLFAAFPDFKLEIESVVAQKEQAAVRWSATGTFNGTGKFEGMKPNGESISLEGCDVLKVVDEQIVENHAYINAAQLARQLGALPSQGSAAERTTLGAFNAKTAAAKAIERFRGRN